MANDNTVSMDSIYRTAIDGVSAASTVPGMTKDIRVDAVTGTAQADALLAPRSQGVISHAWVY